MRKLLPGDKIALVAPAGAGDRLITPGQAFLSERGFATEVFYSKASSARTVAADQERAEFLHQAFQREDIHAVICLRGGYGSNRILPFINFDLIKAHPKPFVGFSDITSLLFPLYRYAALPSFHGPALAQCLDNDVASVEELFAVLSGEKNHWQWPVKVLQSGEATGVMVGGNLSVMSGLWGTPWLDVAAGEILFIEDLNEYLYKIDRIIVQLRHAGVFNRIGGLIVAKEDISDPGPNNSLGQSYEEMFEALSEEIKGPVILGVPCGHTRDQITLPFGANCTLIAEAGQASLTINSERLV